MKSLEKVSLDFPTTVVEILSIPIWYDKYLNTTFDIELSRAGHNYFKDCFPEGRLLNLQQNGLQNTPNKMCKLRGILNRIPENWRNCIESSVRINSVICPRQVVHLGNSDYFLHHCGSEIIYKTLISKVIKLPIGVVRWREILNLSDKQVKTALTLQSCAANQFLTKYSNTK